MLKRVFQHFFQNKAGYLLILVGTFVWSLTMVKSGWIYSYGMGFWGPNGHDGVWHISLINSLAAGNWQMPVFAGESLKNYHLGFDFTIAVIKRLTGIPAHNLYFQIIPPVLALMLGILTYKFVLLWRNSKNQAFWATFFIYFGGSWGWLVDSIRGRGLSGESMFWAQQAISSLINPPFALSLVMLLAGLILLLKLVKRFSWTGFILISLLFGLLIEVKVYAGVLVLGALFLASFKERKLLGVFLSSLFISVLLFFVFNRGSVGLLVFQPFWFLETMMGYSDRLAWQRFFSAMTNYRLGGNWVKATGAYFVAFGIFWVGNLGTRVIKEMMVLTWIKNIKKTSYFEVFFVSVIVAGIFIPMFFLQKGTPWNTIQFVYYSLTLSGILAGIYLGELLEKNKGVWIKIFTAGVVVLTLPTTFGTLGQYLPSRPPAMLSKAELEALSFLAKQPSGIVLTYPYDKYKAKEAEKNPPRPLYLYESTAYVSAFSGQPSYLEDEVNLDITGYSWPARRKNVESFVNSLNQNKAREFLRQNNIRYVYWIKGQRAKLGESQLGMAKIFENKEVDVYRVK